MIAAAAAAAAVYRAAGASDVCDHSSRCMKSCKRWRLERKRVCVCVHGGLITLVFQRFCQVLL